MPRAGINRATFITRTHPSRRSRPDGLPAGLCPAAGRLSDKNGRVTLLDSCYTTLFQRCKALDPLARSRHQRLPGVRGGAAGRMLWTYRNVLSLYENPLHSGW